MAFHLADMKASKKSVQQARLKDGMMDCCQSSLPDCQTEIMPDGK